MLQMSDRPGELTQAELNRLGACVVHDLQDYGEDDGLTLEYEIACKAIEKIALAFHLDAHAAFYEVERNGDYEDAAMPPLPSRLVRLPGLDLPARRSRRGRG